MRQSCIECEKKTTDLYDDPRTPPLDTEACLCVTCTLDAIEEELDERENALGDLIDLRTELQKVENAL